jgi:hypothetical protein
LSIDEIEMGQYKLTKQKNSLFSFGYVEKGTGNPLGKMPGGIYRAKDFLCRRALS